MEKTKLMTDEEKKIVKSFLEYNDDVLAWCNEQRIKTPFTRPFPVPTGVLHQVATEYIRYIEPSLLNNQ